MGEDRQKARAARPDSAEGTDTGLSPSRRGDGNTQPKRRSALFLAAASIAELCRKEGIAAEHVLRLVEGVPGSGAQGLRVIQPARLRPTRSRRCEPCEGRVAIASVSRHVDKSHLVSSGIAAGDLGQFHEREVLECGKGDSLLPDAEAQDQSPSGTISRTISSAAAPPCYSPHSGGRARHSSQADSVEVYFGQVARLTLRQCFRCRAGRILGKFAPTYRTTAIWIGRGAAVSCPD